MSDRWTAWWRRRVPEPARSRAFDPSLADLEREWAGRPPARLTRRLAVAVTAWQCRRLAAADDMQSAGRRFIEGIRLMGQELRVVLRRLARGPVFTLTAVLTLALGIGANLSAAAYVYGFLLAPVNAPAPSELVRVIRGAPGGSTTEVVSWPTYVDVRDAVGGVDLAAYATASAQVGPPDAAELRVVELVSGNYFSVLQQQPAAGRLIAPVDDAAELERPVVVLGFDLWQRGFNGSPGVLGQTLHLNGAPFEIIGVAPRGFRGTYQAANVELWVPTALQQLARPRDLTRDIRGWGWLRLIGRLRAGVTLDQAGAEFEAAAAELNRRFPVSDPGEAVAFQVHEASALTQDTRDRLAPLLTAVLAFTTLLFLVTCANLAGVMQSRLAGRHRELAIRQSLGAGRRRLLGAWMLECLVLACAGGLLGFGAAQLVVSGLSGLQLPRELVGNLSLTTAVDWRLAASAAGLSALAAVLFGVLPARHTGGRPAAPSLREDSHTVAGGRRAVRVRRAAVVVQLAMSGALLLGATLLGRNLMQQQVFDTGFETAHLGLVTLDLARQRVPPSDRHQLVAAALDRIRQDPEVVAADVGASVPLGFGSDARGFRIPGFTPPGERDYVVIDFNTVGADYFSALGLSFIAGGPWQSRPMPAGPEEIVINETMARRFWEGRNPVGETIEAVPGRMLRIAGVVPDVTYYAADDGDIPYVYVPAEGVEPSEVIVHIRTAAESAGVIGRLAQALPAVDPRLAPAEVRTFEELRRIPLFPVRFVTAAAVLFGVLALLLAAVGLYGVVAMSVGERTREIGVRLALGAAPAAVLRGVLREAFVLVGVGLVLAFMVGSLLASLLRTQLPGIGPLDPDAALTVAIVLAGLTLMAAWLPARRAARIDPVSALRQG